MKKQFKKIFNDSISPGKSAYKILESSFERKYKCLLV